MSEQVSAQFKRPKGRSPSYPAISLERAVQLARQLHDKERLHPTPTTDIVSMWGYKSLNGPAAQAISALKKYGLIEDQGSKDARRAGISKLGDVILAHPNLSERAVAIKEAALRPPIHRELWETYGQELPSDRNLRWELTHERGFTETGAAEFIREYRATIAFAQLDSQPQPEMEASDTPGDEYPADEVSDTSQAVHAPDDQVGQQSVTETRQPVTGTTRSYPIPLIGGGVVVVQGNFPITEQDWNQFLAVLNAMRPGLVVSAEHDVG